MRVFYVFIMMSLMAGCTALPGVSDAPDSQARTEALHREAERLLDQPLIDPLTAFLERHAATQGDTPEFRRITRERDSRCRAIGTRFARRAPTPETLEALRAGYQRSCPDQVAAFAQRVAPAPLPSRPAAVPPFSPTPPAVPGTSDCYLLFAIRNTQQALPACTQAAEAGDAKARHHLASLLRGDQAITEARYWARLSAQADHPPGQLLYAELLQLDQTEQGDEQALQLIEAAAQAGLAAAQYQAGMAWLQGVGTNPDRATAIGWLKRASAQGEIAAQLQLAQLYSGTHAEEPATRQWLQQAASLGSGTAQYRLGMSYLEGRGGPADLLEAYVWLSLALLNGEQQAQDTVSQLAGQLSADQLTAARRRINDGRPGRLP